MPVGLPPHRLLCSADGWTPEFEAFFGRFYRDVFARSFPDPDLRETAGRMRRLSDPRGFGSQDPWGYINLLLIHDGKRWFPVGGVSYEWYRSGDAALLTYITVARPYRKRGMGRRLFESALARLARETRLAPGKTLPVFAETETLPHAAPGHEVKEANARYATLRKLGFRILDFPYVQPPLSAGKEHVTELRLLTYQPTLQPEPVPAAQVSRFLAAFYGALMGDALAQDEPCQAVLENLGSTKTIAALPLISHNALV